MMILFGSRSRSSRNGCQPLRPAEPLVRVGAPERRVALDRKVAHAEFADIECLDASAADGETADGDGTDGERTDRKGAARKSADSDRADGAAARRRRFVRVHSLAHIGALHASERADPRARSDSNAWRARCFTQSRHKRTKAQAA